MDGELMMKQICTALLFAFMGSSGMAQQSATPRTAIPLIASDSHHRPTSVTVESLVITDQKTPVTGADLVRGGDLPLQLGLLIDTSGSQRSADITGILQVAKQFLTRTIHAPDDRVFILQFAATSQATGWLTKEQLQSAPVNVSIGGGTALFDAVAMACKGRMGLPDRRKPARRILVLVSDGEDNTSHITREAATGEAVRAGVVIFSIDTDLSGASSRGPRFLDALAEPTGGEFFNQVGRKDVARVFASIEEMIESIYYLTYVPPDASKSGVHEIEVKRASKEKFKLSYPRKYFWNPE